MQFNHKLGFIGAGNMSSAIIKGMLSKEYISPCNINIFDINPQKADEFKSFGLNSLNNISDLMSLSDIVFLAVKPQNITEVLTQIAPFVTSDKIIVSIAAGISINYIKSMLNPQTKVIRVMPNTPLMLGYGATAISYLPPVFDKELEIVADIFKISGIVEVLPEDKMNAVIPLNGSSPAFVYLFAKSLVDSGILFGINNKASMNLVYHSILGSAYMLINSGESPEELIKKVSSPKGTTVAALKSFEDDNFSNIIKKAMDVCVKRADELSK